jgi:transcriptional regulator with XRE-family HTH domain
MELGDVIKSLRSQRGYTQKQLAAAANVAQSAISYAENNTREPTIDVVKKLCAVFNISMAQFFELVDGTSVIDDLPAVDEVTEFEMGIIKKFRCLRKDEQSIIVATIDAFSKNNQKLTPESLILRIGDENTQSIDAG